MLQTEDDLLHRQPSFADDPRGVEQHQATHQAYDQVAIVCILAVHLTGASRQQVFQGPKAVLDPTATLPRPYEPRPADGGVETHHVELRIPGRINNDDGHRTIRRTGRPQPRIAHPRDLRAVPPGPILVLLQVTPLDLASVWQREDIRAFPFNQKGSDRKSTRLNSSHT